MHHPGSTDSPAETPAGTHANCPIFLSAQDFRAVRFLVLDFDGVMTDNRVYVSQDGSETVVCNRSDGMGIQLAQAAGLDVLVLSKERNPVVQARCSKLGVPCIQGEDNKLPVLQGLAEERGFSTENVAYVGNDVNDLECMIWSGKGIAVADAHPEAMKAADRVTHAAGGRGAVREVCDLWMQQNA